MVVAATGFFDGVHKGHRAVLKQLCDIASAKHQESAVITFWPHPRNVLQQDADTLRLLTSLSEKKDLILSLNVDNFYVVPFTKQFSTLSTEEFMRDYLISKFGVSTLIIGYDHRLGNSSVQTQEEMIRIASSLGIEIVKIDEVVLSGKMVSSTKIRKSLINGDIREASSMLGYNYSMQGVVVSGNKIGRTMGFPTANMELYEPLKLVPGNGVYLVKVQVLSNQYFGICNIGNRPTVGKGNARTIETHILNFDENIYGLDIKIELLEKIRDEQKFTSLEELKGRIAKDKEYAYICMEKNYK